MVKAYSSAPYHDDFDITKGYYRILFKPGRAVQARELTQLQTILQNQIEQFGKNIYKDGTVISGGEAFYSTGRYIKLQDTTIDTDFEGASVTGLTSGAKAKVKVIVDGFTQSSINYPSALHITSTNGIEFVANEQIQIDGTTTIVTIENSNTFAGPSYFVDVSSGIYFIKGNFVYADAQTVAVSKTFEQNPSGIIGYTITESIITSDDDESLLDPAVGSNNYFAPGADRYAIDLNLVAYPYDATVDGAASTAVTVNDFVKKMQIEFGKVISYNADTQFNEIENFVAKRTFDQSGDFTVKPFVGKVVPHHYGNTSKLSLEVSSGKAYVKGYAYETIATTFVDFDKARDTNSENGYSISLDYGKYLDVKQVSGFLNYNQGDQVGLFDKPKDYINATSAVNFYSARHIGNARARFLKTDDQISYKLYLFDFQLKSGNTIAQCNSIVSANILAQNVLFSCNVQTFGNANIAYSVDDTYLFPIPQENIKTFKDGAGTTDTTSLAYKLFPSVAFTASGSYSNAIISLSGTESFVGSGTLSDSAGNSRFYVAVTASTGNPPYIGNVLSFAGTAGDIQVVNSQQVKLIYNVGTSFTANIVALTSTSTATAKVKTPTSNTLVFTTAAAAGAGAITANLAILELKKSDVANVISIVDSNGTSYLGVYTLDNGQKDEYYDHARLIYTGNIFDGNANIALSTTYPYLNVVFTYYTHTGTGFFNADSYVDGGLDWGSIPTYTSSQGKTYRLSDVIDYRPVRENDTANAVYTFVNDKVPNPDDTITADFTYYLPRKDKLILTKDRQLIVKKGVSSKSPKYPEDQPDAMTLYTLDVPAYTINPTDVKLVYINNRRYTMRDIGKIEKRVDRLEYYTALSFLEKIAADARIPSAIPGIDRFKNGILVDSFAGTNVVDVRNQDLRCSIDYENRILRPRFATNHILYSVSENDSNNYSLTNKIVTMNYDTVPLVEQLKATTIVNASPFEVFDWVGRMSLDPATDVWGDTTNNPSVTVNVNGENDAFTQITLDSTGLTPWGTRWNDWQSVFKGVTDVKVDVSSSVNVDNKITIDDSGKITVTPTATTDTTTRTTLTTQENFIRSGLQFSSAAKTITTSLGEKVVDTSIIPYIRSKPVKFVGQQLKPDTALFASFDGIDVTEYCIQASRLQVRGTNTLPTTSQIRVYGDGVSAGGIRCEANVIFQRGNVIYYQQNNQTYPFETSNSITLVTSTGLISNTAANSTVVVSLDIADNETLYTDSFGVCAGTFFIPNEPDLRFNMGERAFKLADSLDKNLQTTAAETKYLAYGLATTKEETILATRMNLVSIDPLQQVKQGEAKTSVSTSTSRTSVTGTSNAVALAPENKEAPVKQTFFCGEQTPKASGGIGEVAFKINLGTNVGLANVNFQAYGIPDRLTAIYNGETRSTGFITSLAYNPNNPTFASYDNRLKNLGFAGISPSNGGRETISFIKQKAGAENLIVKIDACLKGTGWNFSVNCPSGTSNPAPGTGLLRGERNSIVLLRNSDNVVRAKNGANTVLHSAKTDLSLGFTIFNTASRPQFSINGVDKSFDITNIEILPVGGLTPKESLVNEGSLTIEYGSGESEVRNGTIFPSYLSTRTRPRTGQPTAITSLPHAMVAGQSNTFSLRIVKEADQVIRGRFKVKVTATGPSGSGSPKSVVVNEFPITINSLTAAQAYPKDPLSQTFFVDERLYTQGVFVDSLDLWFRTKDTVTPITLEIRPVVNGYPSSFEIMPFATVLLQPEQVVASTTFDTAKYTRFKFDSPVHLPPGQYAFVVQANSTQYVAYSAVLGQFQLDDPTKRVTEQPYIGSLFKSQNASTWTAEQNEDLTFRINIADFGDAQYTTVVLTSQADPKGNIAYDLFNTTGDTLLFPSSSVIYGFRTTTESTGLTEGTYRGYLLGTNYPMESRKFIRAVTGDDLRFVLNMQTTNRYVAPVFDLERIGAALVRNIINNDATNEDQYSGGNADAKYISRRVILNPGFEAQDLKVYFNAYLPKNSSVQVYYKVNAPETIDFDSQNKWTLMTMSNSVGDERNGFAEFTYGTSSGYALTNQAFFNTFAIKIVMLSDDPVYVPIIKDFRCIALEAP